MSHSSEVTSFRGLNRNNSNSTSRLFLSCSYQQKVTEVTTSSEILLHMRRIQEA